MSIKPRTSSELKLMRKSGQITATALKKALEASKAGVSLLEVEKAAMDEILTRGAKASFMSVEGYKWATCLTINQEVVHGIPRDIKLNEGDVFSIDVGAVFEGWHTDAAWSLVIREPLTKNRSFATAQDDFLEKNRFLKVGEEAMWAGIKQAVNGNRVGDISEAIQTRIEADGYSVVHSLVGHGVGKELHEEPEVPGFGKKGKGSLLRSGVTLAIEAIYTQGLGEVILERDGWTISSRDGSLGGLFEMSVVVGKDKVEVLTDWRGI